jgi:glycosyltransferase involved in cell wall biosynthesis
MTPLVSIVVEAYNEEHNGLAPVGEAMDALRAQDFPLDRVELILIGSAEEIGHWRTHYTAWPPFGEIRMIEVPPGDAHYWKLKNQGAELARADIVAFIDCDGWPAVTWLAAAVGAIQAGADVSVGPSQYRTATLPADSPWMLAAALPSWSFQLARTSSPRNLQAASLFGHNLAIRRDLLLKYPFPVFQRSFSSSLLFFQLLRSGAKFSYQPQQRVAHAMTFRWWLSRKHFRRGWETYTGRALDRDWPRIPVLRHLPLIEPLVLRMGLVCLDARHWFRFSRVLGASRTKSVLLFPIALGASLCARSAEMIGMYSALLAPGSTERQARF